ncbi:Brp/Blh family beta-carotene 15,15'-dioxygenase [Pseudovibrio sp. SPO723]|uniref:Brp/Blh family beta-carotene 15,15'-dioxygenase n=1 Tax=Nesiotobacter zosterae TaxID=392721 RepID=UPI0029C2DBF2|nr:Brp/Blh family beta-carotene 15,15'-dioxygenase [Pseudovibrio sp. SPO723]MDX5594260.1 Brp/Blh family beta-carotene 15,15'-dioxygenase [Pseudovibrio sp. SPO723]
MNTARPIETMVLSVLAVLAAVSYYAGLRLPLSVEVGLLATAVAFLGVPHGAADARLALYRGLWHSPRGLVIFHGVYVALAALALLLWWVFPIVGLSSFLLYSAWHFAGDWREALAPLPRFVVGLAMLSAPCLLFQEQVAFVYQSLAGQDAAFLSTVQGAIAPALLAGGVGVAGLCALKSKRAAGEILLVLALACLLPPLVFFALYFCFFHSIRHFRGALEQADQRQDGQFLPWTVGYSFATLVAATIAVALVTDPGHMNTSVLQAVFIGLACLTVPHMVLMDTRA